MVDLTEYFWNQVRKQLTVWYVDLDRHHLLRY